MVLAGAKNPKHIVHVFVTKDMHENDLDFIVRHWCKTKILPVEEDEEVYHLSMPLITIDKKLAREELYIIARGMLATNGFVDNLECNTNFNQDSGYVWTAVAQKIR